MYVSSTAPIPQNSMSPLNPNKVARSVYAKQRVALEVARAISEYNCAAPVSSFSGQGPNFQYQVSRAAQLLNQTGQAIANAADAQRKSTATGTSSAPHVTPLNPVNTNPTAEPQVTQPGPWAVPNWGDAASAYPGICTPGTTLLDAMANHPWWTLGALAAIALAGGALGAGVKRYRGRRR